MTEGARRPSITFVIPVRNDAVRLQRCLTSILGNRSDRARIEIVVLDNGSRDGSAAVARQAGATVLTNAEGKVAELRNIGARHAEADLIAFVDADNEISSQWVAVAIDTLMDPGAAAAGAHYHAPPDGTWVQRAYGFLRGRPQGIHDTEWLGSGNLVVRRATFEQVGGFNASLETCEDVDLCRRLRARGHRIVSDARLESIHHGDPATLAAVFRGERWRGRDNLRVSFTPPVSWQNIPSALIPVFDTVMLAAVVAGVVASLAGNPAALIVSAMGVAGIAVGTTLKVARAVVRERVVRAADMYHLFLVALVYDLARAVAVVSRAPHRNARYVEARQ